MTGPLASCDRCDAPAVSAHLLPTAAACREILFACPAHEPESGDSSLLEKLWSSPAFKGLSEDEVFALSPAQIAAMANAEPEAEQ